ncbi:DNA alkylation repair protein [Metabacillus bambusae]|uniref:DNA alkylation repair protein n=1 Tax=Metabacillus bambusae TaxID=2795218 RepID=A0ABS3MYT3_9BACI|nr:DNA alkylation repair protein [Metabacillus bambusae]MBO1510986.1 DNA alkylation repair protein [Metabacillus bambusae]
MAEELRNLFDQDYINELSTSIKSEYRNFDSRLFQSLIYDDMWNELALKQRVRHITNCLHKTLAMEFVEVLELLKKVAPRCRGGLTGIVFPDYVEVYGLEFWNESIDALEYFTQFSTSEFAVRPFVMKNQSLMIEQFLKWSKHPNEHVRRLASEGSRPRLPWGIALTSLKKDPTPIFPILENLKEDPSLYVRKSVANNLNDISKDHPEIVLAIAKKWYGDNNDTNWIIKRGIRTLMKKGDQQALELFGFGINPNLIVEELTVTDKLTIGDALSFSFQLISSDEKLTKIRVEYALDFVKANGKHSTKLFKIAENVINPDEKRVYTKKHSFKDLTTRKHYPGKHKISIVVNGETKASEYFTVV